MLGRQGQVTSGRETQVWRQSAAMRRTVFWTCLIICIAGFLGTSVAQAPPRTNSPTGLPVLLDADEVNYDEQLGIVSARGSVELSQGDRVLRADVVSYNRQTNVVSASGNVSIAEPTGDVLFSDYVELSDDMRDGVVQNLRMLLADQSRLAAVSARRSGGYSTIARRAVYSPCDLCKDDPSQAPLWQIKAARITHDQAQRQITYRDAWMEIGGVPLLYTPYMSHPDGTVKRATGLLAPTYLSTSTTGPGILTPYYMVLDDSSDATFEPTFFTGQEVPLVAGTYRAMTAKGQLSGSISGTHVNRSEDQNYNGGHGHIKTNGRFDIDDDWRWGFQGERATDRDYLQRYRLLSRFQFQNSATLTSNLYTEGFRDRSYAAVNGYAFQSQRQSDRQGLSPIVLPTIDYNYVGDPGAYGGHFTFDANALSIYRTRGLQDQRTLMRAGWTLPYNAPSGEIYTLSASVRGDFYNTTKLGELQDSYTPTEDGVNARAIPEISLEWRYPFVRRDGDFRTIVEPIAQAVASPVYGSQSRFPNEDSRAVNFDDTNLFRTDRFDGYDRVEGGERVNYGVKTTFLRNNGMRAGTFFGQSYRFQEGTSLPQGSGLENQSSNYVGNVYVTPHPWFSTRYAFQLSRADFSPARETIGASMGPSAAKLGISYVFVDQRSLSTLPTNVDQLGTTFDLRLNEHWRTQARYLTSLSSDGGSLLWGGNVAYEDECIIAVLDLTRRYVGTQAAPPDTAVFLRLVFRNIGEITQSVF